MTIWKKSVTIDDLNNLCNNTLAETLGIRFTAINERSLQATMPVTATVHQPYGLLHGGASAALAETIASVASWMCIEENQWCVGMEINCNHVKGKRNGVVTAHAEPIHLGATTHVWDIRIMDEWAKLICISRLTVAIIKSKSEPQ